jgi:hypothetical protein
MILAKRHFVRMKRRFNFLKWRFVTLKRHFNFGKKQKKGIKYHIIPIRLYIALLQ